MTIKLTDAQQLMLSAAAQRDDRILAMPPNLKGGAAQKVAAKLIARRLGEGGQGEVGRAGVAPRRGERTGVRAETDRRWSKGERERCWPSCAHDDRNRSAKGLSLRGQCTRRVDSS